MVFHCNDQMYITPLDVAETFANESLCICAYLCLWGEFWLLKYKSWCYLFATHLLTSLSSISLTKSWDRNSFGELH